MSANARPIPAVTPQPADRYVKEAPLGRGAWGVVYRARDAVIGRTVALKIIQFDASLSEAEQIELAVRSEREARAAGALNHPNIVTIYDAGRGTADSSFFIVMEYVEGMTLRDRLGRAPIPPAEAAFIARQVAAALDFAHRHGIVHRDVKPANILIRKDGLAKLADFGIAKMEASDLTRSGQSMGSPAYMSPEQALGRSVDARSDLFSLGVVLYEMLAGRRPFEGETTAAVCMQIVSGTPPPPSHHNHSLPAAWDAVVMKAISKRREDRQPSAAALLAEIETLGSGGIPAAAAPQPGTTTNSPSVITPPAAAPAQERSGGTLVFLDEGSDATKARGGAQGPRLAAGGAGAATSGPETMRGRVRKMVQWAAGILLLGLVLALAARGVLFQAGRPATIKIDVAHGIKSGTVSVAVDGSVVWRQAVAGEPEQGSFKGFLRKVSGRPAGRASGEIRVAAGDHTFTVTADSDVDGGKWMESMRRTLEKDAVETLQIRIRAGLSNDMELDWK